jgi:hypothetical protein
MSAGCMLNVSPEQCLHMASWVFMRRKGPASLIKSLSWCVVHGGCLSPTALPQGGSSAKPILHTRVVAASISHALLIRQSPKSRPSLPPFPSFLPHHQRNARELTTGWLASHPLFDLPSCIPANGPRPSDPDVYVDVECGFRDHGHLTHSTTMCYSTPPRLKRFSDFLHLDTHPNLRLAGQYGSPRGKRE